MPLEATRKRCSVFRNNAFVYARHPVLSAGPRFAVHSLINE